MSEPLSIIDLTNYREHPTRKDIMVFHFRKEAQADYFENLLKEKELFYEKFVEEEGRKRYLFAVRKKNLDEVINLSNLSEAKFRSKFIPDKFLRIVVFLLSAIILGLAIAGAIISSKGE